MQADATFVIGSSHEICQDWAAAGGGDQPWALISDGCSGAPRSDFGARLIGRAAEEALEEGPLSPWHVVARAADHASRMGLSPRCLDATLLAAWRDGDRIRVLASGDGVVVARRDDGRIESWSIEHPDGAPAYLSYLLDEARLATYLAAHGHRRILHRLDGHLVSCSEAHLTEAPWSVSWTFDPSRHPVVAVMSDGARALRPEVAGGPPVSLERALDSLLAFKRMRGRFVRRRVRSLTRRSGWRLDDDLAVAALAEEPRPEARPA